MDVASALQLSDAFAELPARAGASVELDLAGVTFIDSSGLTALLRLADSVEAAGGTTVIRNPSATVTKLLTITQLESRFGLS
jgi:anti-anti-sigma factor